VGSLKIQGTGNKIKNDRWEERCAVQAGKERKTKKLIKKKMEPEKAQD